MTIAPSKWSSWTWLTLFSLRTLGIAQASLALLSLNCKFQHDIWKHLLFILSFWGSQFNTFVYGKVGATYAASQGDSCHRNVIHVSRKIFTFSFSMQNAVGKLAKLSCENIFFLYVAFQIIWNIFLFVFCFLSISYQFLPYFTCFLKRH